MERINSIFENIDPDASHQDEIKDKAFDLIDEFVAQHFEEDFCELLISKIEPKTDLRKVARTLDILVWSTPDNGKRLDKLTRNWLNSNDGNKIRAILFRKDWLPTHDWEELSKNIIYKDTTLKPLIDYYTRELDYWRRTGLRNLGLLEEAIKASMPNSFIN
ncbi:hypothetical protein [Fulvivirga sp.]|uniref:hypothetical protein n=1 Tax=Fulvivirga sp. TaxID=1931237 RepID=UPI0032EE3291